MTETQRIESDFDLIAQLPDKRWTHNNYFIDFVMREIPNSIGTSLEVGCGNGELCNLINSRSEETVGIDLSGNMIEKAKSEYGATNIKFVKGDYFDFSFQPESIDVIISIATVHHMDFDKFLVKSKNELKKNGKLIIIDLYNSHWKREFWRSVVSKFFHLINELIYNKRLFSSKLERKYWSEHGKDDTFMDFEDINEVARDILGNPEIRKQLFWRYSLVWTKN